MNYSTAPLQRLVSPVRRALAKLVIGAAIFGCLTASLQALVDPNITKQVWRLKNGVTAAQIVDSVWLNADADGDGATNGEEIAAGTNPFNPSGSITVKSVVLSGGNAQLTFPTEVNKLYRVERATSPASTATWTIQSTGTPASVTGNGSDMTIAVPHSSDSFYRVRVDELDTDGDGVSDWAETVSGLNPNAAQTTAGVNDGDYVNAQIAIPNEVNIKAGTAFASEDGPTAGTFVVTRKQKLVPMTVNLTTGAGNTAVAGVDYSALPNSVSFAAGQDSVTVSVVPMQNPALSGSKAVTKAVVADQAYTVGANGSATVIINDSTAATGTGLLARYYDTASSTYADVQNFGQTGTYSFTRNGSTPFNGSTIVVPFTYSGSPALQVGHQVKIDFTSGNLSGFGLLDNTVLTVSAVTPGVSFTITVSGSTLPATGTGNCNFSIQSFPHPATVTRIDPTVNFDWIYGTPHDVTVVPNSPVDNYSTLFEGYLNPTTAGNYRFQLDADDKARVLLDLNGDGIFQTSEQILEHGWDDSSTVSPADGVADNETIGTFKQTGDIALVVPAGAAQRYKIRVEHVETTGEARCRLQWLVPGTTSYANIPQANVFTHTRALTNYSVTSQVATINTAVAHGLTAGVSTVTLYFTAGSLFTPPANYSGTYTVATTPTTTSFTISVPGAANQSATTGLMVDSTSTTTGWLNQIYTNTSFTAPAGYVSVVNGGPTNSNNGIWGSGSPDPLIGKDTFSARWTGQVQPEYSETYTFTVVADDGCQMWINGQLQELKMVPSSSQSGSTYSYTSSNGDTVITYSGLKVNPSSFAVGEIVRLDFTSGNLTHGNGSTYTYDGVNGILTVDYANLPNIIPGGFTVGETIELDPTSGSLTSLSTLPYEILSEPSNHEFTVAVPAGLFDSQPQTTSVPNASTSAGSATVTVPSTDGLTVGMAVSGAGIPANEFITAIVGTTQITITTGTGVTAQANTTLTCTTTINILDTRNATVTAATPTTFTVNVGTGKYNTGTGAVNIDIANKELKDWSSDGNERYVRIPMVAGVRYDIQLDMWENTGAAKCQLSWYSPSQPKQIIPSARLYPTSGAIAPPAHVTSTDAIGLVGGGFSLAIAGSNGSTVTLSGNPAWLTYSGGVLSGTPPSGAAGDYQVLVTITNAAGTSTSVVNLHVDENSGSVTREYWNGSYASVADIPVGTTPAGSSSLTSLEGPTDFGDNYGDRIRGYITAPTTGNYYFWIAGSNAAELWISNDDEPINAFKRAWVNTGSTTPQAWTVEANQKSPWLALTQGKKYYFEVLHKAGSGSGDNVAVGWAKPGGDLTTPSEVVPGYALSTYTPPAPGSTPGTLYVATLLSQSGAATNGVGNSTLRLSEDESYAIMTRTYSGLSGPITSEHIHADPYLSHPSDIIFDIDDPGTAQLNAGGGVQPDGSYKWIILPVGGLSAADIREIIKQGKAYINLHTALYPNGEIRGNYTLAEGSRTFTPPPAPPAWTDDAALATSAGDAARARFLTQATFGPNIADMTALKNLGSYEAWIDAQFNLSPSLTSHQLPEVIRTENASAQGGAYATALTFNAWWRDSISGPDQLRQRIAFALSEIHVVSGQGPLENNALALSYFYDRLADNAFGNFRDILVDTTLTPSMGRYLDMLRNDKPDQTVGRIPNENYAREIKQLFSIGLYRMWPDGTLMLTSKDAPIDTYTQREIVGLAHVFTGWDYGYDGPMHTSFSSAGNWTRQMRETPARHFTGPKRLLNNEVLPGLPTLGGQPLDPYATHTFNNYKDPAYEALPAQELNKAHDLIFNHPNVGPFICRQLIQRLVTSNPSRDYLYRVVQKFNNNGSGVRGDMKAVIKAILLDYEARSPDLLNIPAYGKQREPIMRVAAAARAFRPAVFSGTYSQSNTTPSAARNINVTLDSPQTHKLVGGNQVFLEFSASTGAPNDPPPWIGAYSVASSPAPTSTTFTVTAQGWATGTYSIPANSTVMTVTINSHWLQTGHKAYLAYHTPTGPALTDGVVTVATSGTTDNPNATVTNTFTVDVTANATARSGSVMMPRFSPGSYTISASGLPAPNDRRVTMDTNVNHELNVGDHVWINFYDGNPKPLDREVIVDSVVDLNTWTFLAPSAGTNLSSLQALDQVYQFPLKALPLNRTGNVGSRPSTFAIGSTTTDLEQSPINSPTVFNFFLPDYKYPGSLASQGITTPEFQLTAETTVVRQAQYLYNGVFNPGNTNGLSSFNSGNNSLVMDLGPWMSTTAADLGLGAPVSTTVPWTHNQNISTLIDQLSTLVSAGQLSSNVKTVIKNFVARPIASISPASPNTNPCIVTTVDPHGYTTGDSVVISGVTSGSGAFSPANAFSSTTTARTITVTGPNTFTVTGVTCTVAPSAGGVANAHVSPVTYNMGTLTPTSTEIRDRLRAILHLIITSPDFTIQR